MRRLSLWLALLVSCGLAVPLVAYGDEAAAEEAEPAAEAAPADEAAPAAEAAEAEGEAVAGDAAEAEEAEEEAPAEDAAEVVAEEPEEEEEEESALGEYGASVENRFLMGLDSFVTAPADPVMCAAKPDKEFDELPLAVVTKWPVAFVQGVLLMAHRATSGVLDMIFSPLTQMKMLSPEPRYMIFPDVEHDEY